MRKNANWSLLKPRSHVAFLTFRGKDMRNSPQTRKLRHLPTDIPSLDFILQLVILSGNLFESVKNDYVCITIKVNKEFSKYTSEAQRQLLTHFLDLIQVSTSVHCYLVHDRTDTDIYHLLLGDSSWGQSSILGGSMVESDS